MIIQDFRSLIYKFPEKYCWISFDLHQFLINGPLIYKEFIIPLPKQTRDFVAYAEMEKWKLNQEYVSCYEKKEPTRIVDLRVVMRNASRIAQLASKLRVELNRRISKKVDLTLRIKKDSLLAAEQNKQIDHPQKADLIVAEEAIQRLDETNPETISRMEILSAHCIDGPPIKIIRTQKFSLLEICSALSWAIQILKQGKAGKFDCILIYSTEFVKFFKENASSEQLN